MMDTLKKFFSDEASQPSSVRLVGTLLCIAGAVLLFMGREKEAAQALTSGSALLLGGQAKSAIIGAVKDKVLAKPEPPPPQKKEQPK